MQIGRRGDETRASGSLGYLRVGGIRQRNKVLRAGFDRSRFSIRVRIGMVRLNKADMVKEKLVAPRRAELAALEEDANLGRRAVLVVGLHFNDHRHLVRRVTLENDLFQLQLFAANSRTLFDRALDNVTRDALFARFFNNRGEARIAGRIGAAELGRDHDFFDQFAGGLAFLQTRHFTLGM